MSCRALLLLPILLVLGACGETPCIRHSDCPTSLVCESGACVTPPDAAPHPDASARPDAEPRPDAEGAAEADADPGLEEPDAA
jgi:hypothetical protein